MRIYFSQSSKLMVSGIVISLGWFIFGACDCDTTTKEDNFPGIWVTCIGNQPTLMTYNGDIPVQYSNSSHGNFDPTQWDCSTPNSPPQPKPGAPKLTTSTPAGPEGFARKPHDATGSGSAYLPQPFRDLPFVPNVTPGTPACDGTFPDVFQTVHTQALVTRITTCPFAIVKTIPVVTRPLQVEFTPDGSTALVTSFDNAVNFIDTATNQVTYTLMTDPSINPDGIAITADGTRAYITSFNTTNPVVAVIDIAKRTIIATIPTIAYPQGAHLTPDNSQLWITSPEGNAIDVIDTLTNTEITSRSVTQNTDIAFNSTGTRAYITSAPNSVVEMDTATFQVLNTYTVGGTPTNISMSYGDQFLVVNNYSGGSVSIIDLIKNKVSTNAIGAAPAGISWVR
jgi:hypothetical protein